MSLNWSECEFEWLFVSAWPVMDWRPDQAVPCLAQWKLRKALNPPQPWTGLSGDRKWMDEHYNRLKQLIRPVSQTPRPTSFSRIIYVFWKEVNYINNSNKSLPSIIDGITGDVNFAWLWKNYYSSTFNCVKTDRFTVGNDTCNDDVIVRPNKRCCSIEKLEVN